MEQPRANGVAQESAAASINATVTTAPAAAGPAALGVSGDKPNGTEEVERRNDDGQEATTPVCNIPQVMKIKWNSEESDFLQSKLKANVEELEAVEVSLPPIVQQW